MCNLSLTLFYFCIKSINNLRMGFVDTSKYIYVHVSSRMFVSLLELVPPGV